MYVECKNSDDGVLNLFKQYNEQLYISGFSVHTNKQTRILSGIGKYSSNIVLYENDVSKDVLTYTLSAAHDDVVDAMASLINFIVGSNHNMYKIVQ